MKKKRQEHLAEDFAVDFWVCFTLEIITERLRREFNLELIVTTPSITYEVELLKNGKKEIVYSPVFFPDDILLKKLKSRGPK
jgi:GTP-binding protein LepA